MAAWVVNGIDMAAPKVKLGLWSTGSSIAAATGRTDENAMGFVGTGLKACGAVNVERIDTKVDMRQEEDEHSMHTPHSAAKVLRGGLHSRSNNIELQNITALSLRSR